MPISAPWPADTHMVLLSTGWGSVIMSARRASRSARISSKNGFLSRACLNLADLTPARSARFLATHKGPGADPFRTALGLLEGATETRSPTMTEPKARDYSETLFLPKTGFPMRAGLPQKEPEILARWQKLNLYARLRAAAAGRPRFILHDGPPYANGNIHIGHALNKILKDVVTRSQQMLGFDSNYVPGWDCHGLPIEWKIEEENYRAKGKPQPDFSDDAALVVFRTECRQFAEQWIKVQREEFERLGVVGDWAHPYTTMDFAAEAQIARELMKFAANGTLYRGSKPVMWSVVGKTALAEAEVEYEDYTSDTVWVKFPIVAAKDAALAGASIVIWTTTPWTIPGNRAISFSPKIEYGLYTVVDAPADNWAKPGDRFVLADKLAVDIFRQARVTAFKRLSAVTAETLATVV